MAGPSSRGPKPIVSILSECAYSAAYALASAADIITVPRTGGAGSLGVVACHVDISEALKSAGIKVTYIQYGERKTDGAPEKPLSDKAVEKFRTEIDSLSDIFVATVARNRSLRKSVVIGTEAATYLGADAVSVGLCDDLVPPDLAL